MNEKKSLKLSDNSQSHLTVDKAYTQAVDHFNVRCYTDADKLCTAIIQTVPNHIDAINLLGVVAQKLNRHDLAVEQFQKAIKIDDSRALLYYNLGTSLYPLGRIEEAVQALKTALVKEPGNNQIINYLNGISNNSVVTSGINNPQDNAQKVLQRGMSFHQSGQLDEAIHCYQITLEFNPENAAVLSNLGAALQATGRLEEAVSSCQKAIAIKPDYVEAYYNLGITLKAQGKLEAAVKSFQKAIVIKPDFTKVYYNLGAALQEQGNLEAAVASYQKAIAIKPDYVDAYSNIGNVLQEQGNLEAAVASYQKAIAIKPDFAEAHSNLGAALQEQGNLEEAITSYQKAIAIRPDFANAYSNLGVALMDVGKYNVAFVKLQHSVTLEPQNSSFWNSFALCLEQIAIQSYDENLAKLFSRMLEQPTVLPKRVAGTITSMLLQHPIFMQILELARTDDLEKNLELAITQLSKIPLFLKMLELSPIQSLDVEMILSRMRYSIINSWVDRIDDPNKLLFYSILAHQCFNNDYVYMETPKEAAAVNNIQDEIENFLAEKRSIPPAWIAILGSYRPLYIFPWAKKLLEYSWPDELVGVLKSQLSEPLEEQEIRSRIPSMTSVKNATSMAVRNQYEDNPYPRWKKAGLCDQPKAAAQTLKEYCIDIRNDQSPAHPEILIAGCGTGHQALQAASRFSNSRIMAVDLSLNSLSYALRKTKELKFSNIEYIHGDILELGNCGRAFDIIECRGVLHHLKDPLAGWQVLVDLLRAGGIMKIGLYSKTARRQVAAARAMIAELGYSASPDDIRRFRQELIVMSKSSRSEVDTLVGSIDFFSLSECRDLLFHVQEHQFTLPEIKLALKGLGLRFLGFEMNNNHIMRRFRELYQEKDALVSLSRWHNFELQNPLTFSGLYEFWVQKK
jgi:tetratricopeptide (TPR) repeat protein